MDKFRLEYELKKKGISVDRLCKEIGISKSAYYRKISGKSEFTLSEIKKVIATVGIEDPADVFFADTMRRTP